MGHFATNVGTMQKAVSDLASAQQAIDTQITTVAGTAEATISSWRGAGGTTLRQLMVGYHDHATALQNAIRTFQTLLGEQAVQYGVTDSDATAQLVSAGGGLRL